MGQPHKHGKNENNSAAVKAKMEQVTGQTDLVNMLINQVEMLKSKLADTEKKLEKAHDSESSETESSSSEDESAWT